MNSKVRAEHAAKTTSSTFVTVLYINRVIPLAIELGSSIDNMLWTKLNAVATALAPFGYHTDLTTP